MTLSDAKYNIIEQGVAQPGQGSVKAPTPIPQLNNKTQLCLQNDHSSFPPLFSFFNVS
jgi:hypothetical protein